MSTKISSPLAATDGVAYVIRKQAEIEQRISALERLVFSIPDDIDRLADAIGYPITNVRVTRECLHELATKMRAQIPASARAARHG